MSKFKQVYDPIREIWTLATPEEIIRQKWIEVMIEHLGFPKAQLVVEKKMNQLPHLNKDSLPNRRIDVLAYYKDLQSEMKPLLLMECKAIPLNHQALLQVMGYQSLVGSPFIALANEEEIRVGYRSNGLLEEISFLPDYRQLKQLALKAVVSSHHF